MAEINIVHEHRLNPEMSRDAASKVADKMAAEYGMQCRWEGDVLCFGLSGMEGTLTLDDGRAAVYVKLSGLMGMMASAIEAKMAENMRKVFGAA